MPADHPQTRNLPLLGYALLLACAIAGLWLATEVVLPSALSIMEPHGTRIPAFYDVAFRIWSPSSHLVYPLAFTGVALLVMALLRRGPLFLVSICRTALPIQAGVVACFSIYLLGSGGLAYHLASGDQLVETRYYKRTLEQFALLEAAQGRYEKVLEDFKKSRDIKMVEARSASEFNDNEANERISSLLAALPKATDLATKRRILATITVFRERIRKDSFAARDVPRLAAEAGAPPSNSHVETFDWIAANLNKDGWDPLPLFKLSR